MKKSLRFLAFLLMSCLLLCTAAGCNKEGEQDTPVQGEENSFYGYTFAPIQETENISNAQKKELLDHLKEAGEPKKGVSFYGYDAQWQEDGSLNVLGFVRNNCGNDICDIKGTFEVIQGSTVVARADFTLGEEQFGQLQDKDNRPWTLKYTAAQVQEHVEDLSQYTMKVTVDYTILQ